MPSSQRVETDCVLPLLRANPDLLRLFLAHTISRAQPCRRRRGARRLRDVDLHRHGRLTSPPSSPQSRPRPGGGPSPALRRSRRRTRDPPRRIDAGADRGHTTRISGVIAELGNGSGKTGQGHPHRPFRLEDQLQSWRLRYRRYEATTVTMTIHHPIDGMRRGHCARVAETAPIATRHTRAS